MSSTFSDVQWMSHALQLAARGRWTTTPNPAVGCVIVDSRGQLIGEGWHQRAGEPHAEVYALKQAGDRAANSTVYVTLEPCSHHGRTGPCAQALINAGVARVVIACHDPNPQVAGSGIKALEEAGIIAETGLLEDQAVELNRGFFKRMARGLPWVTVKMAMSLDGRTAMADGASQWITGPEARADGHRLRARSCAVVTGVGSILRDDPKMNVRLPGYERQPLRVVVDSRARTPERAMIFAQPGKTIIAHGEDVTSTHSDTEQRSYWSLPLAGGSVNLHALIERLAQEGCNDVLVEAGSRLAGAFVASGLVDELVIYMAAKLMGSDAMPLFTLPISTMPGSLSLYVKEVRAVGQDWRITLQPDPYS